MTSIKNGCRIIVLLVIGFFDVEFSFGQLPNLKFEHIDAEEGLPQSTIHGIVKDKYGFMWFGTWDGLCRYDGYTFKIYRFDPKNSKSINNSRIHNILKDKNNDVWILTFKGDELCRYSYEKDNFDRIPVSKVSPEFFKLFHRFNHYETIRYSFKQFKWKMDIHTNSLLQWDTITNEKRYYESNPANRWSMTDPYAVDMYKDNHNIFWVGTISNGINKANLNAKPFEYFYHDPQNSNTIINNNVRAFCEDREGNLWVGTYDKGITVISKNGKYRHITFKGDSVNNYSHNQVRVIFCDSQGIIWIGTKKGLINYTPATGAFRDIKRLTKGNISVFGITEDENHNLWLATFWEGIFKYVRSEDKFVMLDFEKALLGKNARVIIQDRRKQLWIGTEGGGVTVMKPVANTDTARVVMRLSQDYKGTDKSLDDGRVNAIFEDPDGFMWIGTGNGLDCYDPYKNKFIRLPQKTGLANVAISGIIGDNRGDLWISHKRGISKLDRKTFFSRNYTLQDGLQSNEFSDGAAYKSRFNRKLYFGSNYGFNSFNPDDIRSETTLPNTVLTELEILSRRVGINQEINGRVVLHKPLYLTREIELTYEDKSFSIEFAGLHYSNSKANKYAYKLDGFDENWIYTDANRRIASYANLKPGNYTFNVISSNGDGVWNRQPTKLKIMVMPPFWASTYAYIFYFLIILFLAYLYHVYSTRFARLHSKLAYEQLIREKDNELHQSKLQFFTNISHEFKTPLTLILAPVEKLLDTFSGNPGVNAQLTAIKQSGERLLKLLNQLLDFRTLETGNTMLRLQTGDIVAFLRNEHDSFEPLAASKEIKLEFSSFKPFWRCAFDEDIIEKILANLLSNALKFTPVQGWIKVEIDNDTSKNLIIRVINVGKGIPDHERERIFEPFKQGDDNSADGTGIGLAYVKGLIELCGGYISVNSVEVENGINETCFTIKLPTNEAQLDYDDASKLIEPAPEPAYEEEHNEDFNVDINSPAKMLINGKLPIILLVEDNIDLQQYLKAHFENYCQVIVASNGMEGLYLAIEEVPDLIISDVMMPEMDGFSFCRRIKTEVKTAHIPVILLTARTPIEDKIEGIETGADDYITKPFNLNYLTARVRHLLISRNSLKEKYRKEISLQPSENLAVSPDEKFLKKLLKYVEQRISDPELNVEDICNELGSSKTQLYKKMKALTGLSVLEMIKEIRFNRAKQLLTDRKFHVSEVAYMVGFSDVEYFRKCFKVEFGIPPSEYYRHSEKSYIDIKKDR